MLFMRVALVHDYLNQYGGAESLRIPFGLLRSLKPLGFNISATGNPISPTPSCLRPESVKMKY